MIIPNMGTKVMVIIHLVKNWGMVVMIDGVRYLALGKNLVVPNSFQIMPKVVRNLVVPICQPPNGNWNRRQLGGRRERSDRKRYRL